MDIVIGFISEQSIRKHYFVYPVTKAFKLYLKIINMQKIKEC